MPHIRLLICLAPLALCGGCASHLIATPYPDETGAAGQAFVDGQTSVAGRAGVSTDGATGHLAQECGKAGLGRVEVRRDFGQGLVTLLTLGLVSPAKIYYYCQKPADPPESDGSENDDEF